MCERASVRIRIDPGKVVEELIGPAKLCAADQDGRLHYLNEAMGVEDVHARKLVAAQLRWEPHLQKKLGASDSTMAALVIQVPEHSEAYERVQKVRRIHDPSAASWMPHIKLAFPFLPSQHFQLAAIQRKISSGKCTAFDVCLNELHVLEEND